MVTNTQGKGLIIKTWLKSFHKYGMTIKKSVKDKPKGLKKPKNIFQLVWGVWGGVFKKFVFLFRSESRTKINRKYWQKTQRECL